MFNLGGGTAVPGASRKAAVVVSCLIALAMVASSCGSSSSSSRQRNATLPSVTKCSVAGQVKTIKRIKVVCATTAQGKWWYPVAKEKKWVCAKLGAGRVQEGVFSVCGKNAKNQKRWFFTSVLPSVPKGLMATEAGAIEYVEDLNPSGDSVPLPPRPEAQSSGRSELDTTTTIQDVTTSSATTPEVGGTTTTSLDGTTTTEKTTETISPSTTVSTTTTVRPTTTVVTKTTISTSATVRPTTTTATTTTVRVTTTVRPTTTTIRATTTAATSTTFLTTTTAATTTTVRTTTTAITGSTSPTSTTLPTDTTVGASTTVVTSTTLTPTTVAPVVDTSCTAKIGDTGPGGGKVFIVASTSGNSTGLCFEAGPATWVGRWGCATQAIEPNPAVSDDKVIGAGKGNTRHVAAECTRLQPKGGLFAAKFAENLVVGGKSDWFLPSRDELAQLYRQRKLFSCSEGGKCGADLTRSTYWTSSQEDAISASVVDFLGDGTPGTDQKTVGHFVRPVRSFS